MCALVRNDMLKTDRCSRVQGRPPSVIARSEATWQSVLLAAAQTREQCLRQIRKSATNLPEVLPTCQVPLRGRGLPHQCAHWFAMTCRRQRRVSGCKDVPPLSLRGAKRRGNPFSLRQSITESSTSGEYEKAHTDLPEVLPTCQVPLRGKRIATPVCALVRNDMLKTDAFLRVQERFPAVPPGKRGHKANFCLSLRGAKRRGNPHLLAAGHGGGQYFRRIRKSAANSPGTTSLPC